MKLLFYFFVVVQKLQRKYIFFPLLSPCFLPTLFFFFPSPSLQVRKVDQACWKEYLTADRPLKEFEKVCFLFFESLFFSFLEKNNTEKNILPNFPKILGKTRCCLCVAWNHSIWPLHFQVLHRQWSSHHPLGSSHSLPHPLWSLQHHHHFYSDPAPKMPKFGVM